MPRFLLAILFCGLAFSASAQPGERVATVRVRLAADGLHASYRLDRAVTRFEFSEADVERAEDFQVLTPGLAMDGDALTGARAFRRFEILIKPMAHERDAKYPAFFRVGDGGVLYAPALYGEAWLMRVDVSLARGQVQLPAAGPDPHGSLYVGPAAYVTATDVADIVAPPDVPPALRERVGSNVARALEFYGGRLNARLDTRPVVVMAEGGDGQGFVGDVTPGSFVSLRFYGSAEDQITDSYAGDVMRFVSHEVFHFWNGSLVHNAEGTPSWLHEGGADYAALLATMDAGGMDDEGMRAALGSALTRCKQGLERENDVGMDDLQFLSMNVRYPCGIVIQWAASLSAERAGRGGFFEIWTHIIAAARAQPDRAFTLADFYEGAGVDANAPPTAIHLLTAGRGAERWPQLTVALRSLGAEIETGATPDTRRAALIFHLLRQSCGSGAMGFYTEPGQIRLQSNDTCTLLPDRAVLTSVEGVGVNVVSAATYSAVQARCAARQDVRVVLDGARNVAVPCREALANAPESYIVTRWR